MIRLLHISDIHINAGYSNKDASIRKQLKTGMYESLEAAITFALEQRLDAVLIAGDFFDHDKITFQDEVEIGKLFRRLLEADCHIIYTTGNHDPMLTAPFLTEQLLHERFHIFEDDQVKVLNLYNLGGEPFKVVGVGHKSKNEQRSLISNFPQKTGTDTWIGIAHASVPSALTTPDKQNYMATPLSVIEALGYDYFALGHIHLRQKLSSRVAYSGNIQGINIKETGAKGGYLVEIDGNHITVEAVDFNSIEWAILECELTPETATLNDLQALLSDRLSNLISQVGLPSKRVIVRVVLSGKTNLKESLSIPGNVDYLNEVLKNRIGLMALEIKVDQISLPIDLDLIRNEHTVLSQMIERIDTGRYDDALLEKIFALPIFGSKTSDAEKLAYVETMKESLIEEIVERMVINDED